MQKNIFNIRENSIIVLLTSIHKKGKSATDKSMIKNFKIFSEINLRNQS